MMTCGMEGGSQELHVAVYSKISLFRTFILKALWIIFICKNKNCSVYKSKNSM